VEGSEDMTLPVDGVQIVIGELTFGRVNEPVPDQHALEQL
jgi:hypothetical protein